MFESTPAIPATTPCTAHFQPGGDKANERYPETFYPVESTPVLAWDTDGQALVLDREHGRLRAANNYMNFISVSRNPPDPESSNLIAAIDEIAEAIERLRKYGIPHSA